MLINYKNAADPTYTQLVGFLKSDKTDEYPYTAANVTPNTYYGTAKSHVDLTRIQDIIDGTAQQVTPMFAAILPRGCITTPKWPASDVPMCRYLSTGLHSLDAFQTSDKGLIYIDDTGAVPGNGVSRCVKTVSVAVGQAYQPVSLFSTPGWSSTWDGTW